MQLRTTACFLALVTAAGLIAADSTNSAGKLMEEAHKKEVVDGDLKGAIKAYQAIVAKYAKTDRAVAAMALIHVAECYQKTGDAASRKIYEQVVKDYADQKDAVAMARAGLGGAQKPAATSSRLVWSGTDQNLHQISISPDGRLLSYVKGGDLFTSDVATGTERNITTRAKDSPDSASWSIFSRDGKQIAYVWRTAGHSELRLADIADNPNPRRLGSDSGVSTIYPEDWSPDNKFIAVTERTGQTWRMGMFSVADGSFRVLKTLDDRAGGRIRFSPDGKYLGYNRAQSDAGPEGDVFVISADGAREFRAVAHPADDYMEGWSLDGKWLLFSSDRTGSNALWAIAFADGRTQGGPRLLTELDHATGMGMSSSGSLYYEKQTGGSKSKVQIALIDFTAGKLAPTPAPARSYLDDVGDCQWSPDGKSLAYISFKGDRRVLAIRTTATGTVRELPRTLLSIRSAWWTPDGGSFLVEGTDFDGHHGIYRVDAQTGDARAFSGAYNLPFYDQPAWSPDGRSFLVQANFGAGNRPSGIYQVDALTGDMTMIVSDKNTAAPVWSPDGKSIYYRRAFPPANTPASNIQEAAYVVRDLATGQERELIRRSFLGPAVVLSPDGRSIGIVSTDAPSNSRTILLVPAAGGEPRELMRVPTGVKPGDLNNWNLGVSIVIPAGAAWPDGRSLLVKKRFEDPAMGDELWLASLSGGAPRKIDGDLDRSRTSFGLRLNPDGKQLLYSVDEPGPPRTTELWLLENFLPNAAVAGK